MNANTACGGARSCLSGPCRRRPKRPQDRIENVKGFARDAAIPDSSRVWKATNEIGVNRIKRYRHETASVEVSRNLTHCRWVLGTKVLRHKHPHEIEMMNVARLRPIELPEDRKGAQRSFRN